VSKGRTGHKILRPQGFKSVPEPLPRFAGSRARPAGSQKLGLRPREIGLFQQIFKRCPQPKTMPQRYIYLFFGVLSIACLVSFLFLGVTSAKRKASDSSQPKLPFQRIPRNNQQPARGSLRSRSGALAKGRTHTFQPKASFSERKRQKDTKASLIPSLVSDPNIWALRPYVAFRFWSATF